jgi:RNA polymerase sigma factor (sigma-70 family)
MRDLYTEELLDTQEVEGESLVRLRLTTHNARLVDARKERGFAGDAMAEAAGISRGRLREIETLKRIPTEGEMVKIACVLEKPIDHLFPEDVLSAVRAGVFAKRKATLGVPQIIRLTEARRQELITDGGLDSVEDAINRDLLAGSIHEILGTLTPREQRLLELRFGLDGQGAKTLERVGMDFGVTRDRIHQIEAKALRKLRHPSRSRKLKDYL